MEGISGWPLGDQRPGHFLLEGFQSSRAQAAAGTCPGKSDLQPAGFVSSKEVLWQCSCLFPRGPLFGGLWYSHNSHKPRATLASWAVAVMGGWCVTKSKVSHLDFSSPPMVREDAGLFSPLLEVGSQASLKVFSLEPHLVPLWGITPSAPPPGPFLVTFLFGFRAVLRADS